MRQIIRRLRSFTARVLASIVISSLIVGLTYLDVFIRSILTPHLIDAVRNMNFVEAVFSPKGVLDLWFTIRIVSSPIFLIGFWVIMVILLYLVLSVFNYF